MSKRKPRGYERVPKVRGSLGYVRPGGDNANVKAAFMYCVVRAMMHEVGTRAAPLGLIDQACASGQLVEARNDLVTYFLDTEVAGMKPDWLFMVDSDMGFADDTFDQLVASADPIERPVMGALCFALRETGTDPDLMANTYRYVPTVYRWAEAHDENGELTNAGFSSVIDYPRDAVVECDATGAACMVIHRSILEQIRDEHGPVWFDRIAHPIAKTFGEDMSFCVRVAQAGKTVHVNTAVKTAHLKGGVDVTEEWVDFHYAKAKA